MKRNSLIYYLVCADIQNKKIYITSETMKEGRCLGSPANKLINQYRAKYPDYSLETNDLFFINFFAA